MLAISQEELPTRITADKLEIPVSADFRSWIRADLIMKDCQIPEEAKLPVICQYIGLDLTDLDVTNQTCGLAFLNSTCVIRNQRKKQ